LCIPEADCLADVLLLLAFTIHEFLHNIVIFILRLG